MVVDHLLYYTIISYCEWIYNIAVQKSSISSWLRWLSNPRPVVTNPRCYHGPSTLWKSWGPRSTGATDLYLIPINKEVAKM